MAFIDTSNEHEHVYTYTQDEEKTGGTPVTLCLDIQCNTHTHEQDCGGVLGSKYKYHHFVREGFVVVRVLGFDIWSEYFSPFFLQCLDAINCQPS